MRIYNIEIKNNPILGNLKLDFTDTKGNIVDTVIFAGENGCGKTTILECLTKFNNVEGFVENESRHYCLEIDEQLSQDLISKMYRKDQITPNLKIKFADYYIEKKNGLVNTNIKYYSDKTMEHLVRGSHAIEGSVIFLTPEINFTPNNISSVTAKTVDIPINGLRKSNFNIANEITQLIIDIENQDNSDFKRLYKNNPKINYTEEELSPRIFRFNNAFKKIFKDMRIEKIDNINGMKVINFYNRSKIVPISRLSSGEKQIVFRGGYLLKDKETLNGALILIDEPELSLHPEWQKKILDFYKAIFTNAEGIQTSQLFVATHSPYIIHNNHRKNDKIIVLKKNTIGEITVMDKPEYYSCGDLQVVEDAFNEKLLNLNSSSTVYLEGRTDEKYFNKALEIFDIKPNWKFKWIGYIDENGQEKNTGKDSLNKAKEFLIAQKFDFKNICLYDCDARKTYEKTKNVICYSISQYNSTKGINRGIENALNLDNFELNNFYTIKEKNDDYGGKVTLIELDKMKMCDAVCLLPKEKLKIVFENLKKEIDRIEQIIKEEV